MRSWWTMLEEDLLRTLREKFGEALVKRSLELADGGVRLDKDHRMINPGKGIFRDFGVASIQRSESKVEFDLEELSPRCMSCGLSKGTVCHHNLAVLISANRQGFLPDEGIERMAGSLYGLRERGAEAARRLCPNCHRPLDITAQVICPKCGRGVCRDCYRVEDKMCSKCYDIQVLGNKPKAGLGDVLKGLFSRKG
jgi:hypothetical protein